MRVFDRVTSVATVFLALSLGACSTTNGVSPNASGTSLSSRTSGQPGKRSPSAPGHLNVCRLIPAPEAARLTGLPIVGTQVILGDPSQQCAYPYGTRDTQGIIKDVEISVRSVSPLPQNTRAALLAAISADFGSVPILDRFIVRDPVENVGDIAIWAVPRKADSGEANDLVVQVGRSRLAISGEELTEKQALALARKAIAVLVERS